MGDLCVTSGGSVVDLETFWAFSGYVPGHSAGTSAFSDIRVYNKELSNEEFKYNPSKILRFV